MRLGAVLVLVALLAGCAGRAPPAGPPPSSAPPPPVGYDALRIDTEFGAFTIVLYPEAAPKTVDLMRAYAAEGYYRGREFNRVVSGHVIQVIDKAGGATEDARRVPLEARPDYHFAAGAAGIARGSDPGSGGPEFFVMDFATSHLDGNYTVWGQAISGLDVIHRIARVPTVDFTRVPAASDLLTDRQAVDAVAIRDVRLERVDLPGEAAGRLPLAVAKNVRQGDWRHSLEWPRDLRAGAPATLTWYVRTSNDANPAPPAANVQVRVGANHLPVTGEAAANGVYHWRWTPRNPGLHPATFLVDGAATTTLEVRVQ